MRLKKGQIRLVLVVGTTSFSVFVFSFASLWNNKDNYKNTNSLCLLLKRKLILGILFSFFYFVFPVLISVIRKKGVFSYKLLSLTAKD